jgi:hypothetical protein
MRMVGKFWLKLKSILGKAFSVFDLQDILCFGGLTLVGVGLWYWDFRVALVVVGLILMVMGRGIVVGRVARKREEEE